MSKQSTKYETKPEKKTYQPQEKNTQITDLYTYNCENMIFSDRIEAKIPNSPLTYDRIYISTKNEDGTIGDLVIPTEELFCFGVNENLDSKTKELTGYSLALCLYSNSENPTEKELLWEKCFNEKIVQNTINFLLDNKKQLRFFDLDERDLRKFNPIYRQKDKETGEFVKGKSPVLSPKLIENRKKGTIDSIFYDSNGNDINPLTLIKKNCRATTLIKIESIYHSGSKFSLQYKVYESEIRIVDRSIKPLRKKRVVSIVGENENETESESLKTKTSQDKEVEKLDNLTIKRKGSIENDDEEIVQKKKEDTEKELETDKVKRKVKKVKKVEKEDD